MLTINNVRAVGLNLLQGLYMATPFYWDVNDDTRAFAKRFNPRHPKQIAAMNTPRASTARCAIT